MSAHKLCRRNKQHKRGAIMFEVELGHNIIKLIKALTDKKYKLGKYKTFTIYDPKKRLIEALSYKDRVVLMCFCKNSIEPRLEKRLIHDNAASRTGKGSAFAIKRLHGFMRKLYINTQRNEAYFLKCDIAKYFQSIDHAILLSKLRKCGFSADEMWFMELVIRSHGTVGLPLGNQTSQWFALLYLDEIDRLIKEKLRVPYYVRYMDDFVLLHEDKAFLQKYKAEIERVCSEKLKLKLNNKTQTGKLKNGIDFLGFNHKLSHSGKITKSLRASSRERQRHYLKTISYYYLQGILDDDYINIRINSFGAHLKGTNDLKYVRNKLNALKRRKTKGNV
ncbi:MAG: RNA-directed DNA polymerase [Alphaproteobacteria bacterium]|nr:RNA-directed DNA polymerase [Alphaproteobacteria bacterium]